MSIGNRVGGGLKLKLGGRLEWELETWKGSMNYPWKEDW